MSHPTDDELRQRRNPSEDHFTERKTTGDSKDWLRTVVAFANSTPIDKYALLFIGVKDDGSIEPNVMAEAAQAKLAKLMADAYPPIDYTTRTLIECQQPYLCVIVPGSTRRPHFAGPAFVRVGARTVKASEEQFNRLVAERNSKAYRILQNQGQFVETRMIRSERAEMLGRVKSASAMQVVDCSQSTLTLRYQSGQVHSFALDRVDVLERHDIPRAITLEIRS